MLDPENNLTSYGYGAFVYGAAKGAKFKGGIKGAVKLMSPSKVAKKIINAERIGSWLKNDTYHRAASYLSERQLSKGKVYDLY